MDETTEAPGCGMDMYRRHHPGLPYACETHDRHGHHYTTADGQPFVLFKRTSVERVAMCVMFDQDVQPGWRGRHPDNDGSPDWTPLVQLSGDTAGLVLRLGGAIIQSMWLEKALDTAYQMGAVAERGRLVHLLDTRTNIQISDVPGIMPGRTGVAP